MTNLVGAILMIMSVETTPIMVTNQVGISCEQAGCTNWCWREITTVEIASVCEEHKKIMEQNLSTAETIWLILGTPCGGGKCSPAKTHEEKHKSCQYFHFKDSVVQVATREKITVGAGKFPTDGIFNQMKFVCTNALFTITTQTVTTNRNDGYVIYNEGTWIERVK